MCVFIYVCVRCVCVWKGGGQNANIYGKTCVFWKLCKLKLDLTAEKVILRLQANKLEEFDNFKPKILLMVRYEYAQHDDTFVWKYY